MPLCGRANLGRNMWHLCGPHWSVVRPVAKALSRHHVPAAMVVRLILDPTCFNPGCGTNLLLPVRVLNNAPLRPPLHVDHDHAAPCHCGPVSCGQCVNGLLCHGCNPSAGLLGNDPARAHGLGEYLEAVTVARYGLGLSAATVPPTDHRPTRLGR
jgi:hypothetical protein